MLYPMTKLLIALSLAYATVPPHARQGLRKQLTMKNIARCTATSMLASAACGIAHEAGHALTARYFGGTWPEYLCVGAPVHNCTPQTSMFQIGNFHIGGWDIRQKNIGRITSLTPGQEILMLLAGPLSGLIANACIQRLSKGTLYSKHIAPQQLENLLPRWKSGNDGAQIIARLPKLNVLFETRNGRLITTALDLGLKGYTYWPSSRTNNSLEKTLAEKPSYKNSLRNFVHACGLASCNQTFLDNVGTTMRFDIEKGSPADVISSKVTPMQ